MLILLIIIIIIIIINFIYIGFVKNRFTKYFTKNSHKTIIKTQSLKNTITKRRKIKAASSVGRDLTL